MNGGLDPQLLDTIIKAVSPLAAGFAWLYYQFTFGRRARLKHDLEVLELCSRLDMSPDVVAKLKASANERLARSIGGEPGAIRWGDLVMALGSFAVAGLLWATSDITATGWRLWAFILLVMIGLGGVSNAVNPPRRRH